MAVYKVVTNNTDPTGSPLKIVVDKLEVANTICKGDRICVGDEHDIYEVDLVCHHQDGESVIIVSYL